MSGRWSDHRRFPLSISREILYEESAPDIRTVANAALEKTMNDAAAQAWNDGLDYYATPSDEAAEDRQRHMSGGEQL